MSKLSQQQVEQIANLARIELNEKEKSLYSEQLSEILGFVEKLNEIHECTNLTNITNHLGQDSKKGKVNIKDVKETSQVTGLENVYRDDVADERTQVDKDKLKNREKLLANAPAQKNGYIKVRQILE